ncbi:MAG TPA: protein kinase, partial [Polyangiaceae bacterium]|nr:protein kinase [Polyangiaceae bacterium]
LDVVFRSGRPSGRSPWSIAPEGRVTAALRIAEQLLDALEMAHAHRVVHGALTPANVIVTERQTVRLVDFAIAPGIPVVLGGALRRAHASRYTAPEGEPSEAADVWSVGACLYFALTGSPPPGTLPALAGVTPDVGRGLAAVLEHALAVDPDDRYGSAYAMLGDVRRVLVGRPPRLGSAATPVSSQRASPLPASGSFEPGPTTDPTSDRSGRRQLTEAFSGPAEVPAPGRGEWRGNALLFLAIALVAAVATFVLMRERLADPADVTGPAPTQAPSR